MSTVKRSAGRFRVGDPVEFLYGAQLVVGRVTENRGPIGMRGRRLYGVRIESGDEPIVLELPEDDLSKAADADIAEWQRSGRTTAVHQTITFHGDQADAQGRPSPLFHYLIVAKPGPGRDSGMASVISLSEARATGTAQGPSQTIRIDSGGPIAALDAAEAALSERHRGMHKIVGPRRP